MSTNDVDKRRSHTVLLWFLGFGMVAALAGDAYQFVRGEQVARNVELLQQRTQSQIAKLSDSAAATMEENQQRFEAMKNQVQGSASATLRQAKSEVKKTGTQLAQAVEEKHQEVVSQLSDLKQDTSTKLDKVSTDLEQTGQDLKRVVGDLGITSGQVATNAKELATLKQLGERNYYEFDLTKTKEPQKVGDIRLILQKTDPKHNRYTVQVLADDKKVDKKDKTVNEPVQLYVSGSRQPYEIVVNQVKKNEVVGYLATPKLRTPRGQQASE
jgi:dsDNA-specific endonuclease/ATPase MutS2